MFRNYKALIIVFLSAIVLAVSANAALAATGTFNFTGTGYAGTTCANSVLDSLATIVGDTIDTTQNGVDYDFVGLVIVDANGQILFVGADIFPMGTTVRSDSFYVATFLGYPISARPVTAAMFDIEDSGTSPFSGLEAWFNYVTSGTLLDQDSIDPASISPACSGLPLLSPFQFPGGGGNNGGGGGGNPGGSPPTSGSSQSIILSPPFRPGDSRLNADPGASAVVYCQSDGSIYVYGINEQARGYFAFRVSRSVIDEVGVPDTNTKLGSATGTWGEISLWRLTSGEFQLHAPGLPPETSKSYDFIFDGCVA